MRIPKALLDVWLRTKELRELARETKVLDQIERALQPGDRYDAAEAEKAIAFFRDYLVHIEGDYAGEAFVPDLWEELVLRTTFGFFCADGSRKIQRVFIEIPRRNGKSSFAAGIVLKCLFADDEIGAQVYGAAWSKDQAGIIFRVVELMILRSPQLKDRAEINHTTKRINVVDPHSAEPSGSFYQAVKGEEEGQTGYNAHCYVVDEEHELEDDKLLGVLRTSTASRRNPLAIKLTTAGDDVSPKLPWMQDHARALAILAGTVTDSRGLVIVFAADPQKDDWKDERSWVRCNPALRSGFKRIENMRSEFEEALGNPEKERAFRQFHLNIPPLTRKGWLAIESWDRGGGIVDESAFAKQDCFIAVDLATVDDIAAVGYLVPAPAPDPWRIVWDFFVPADNVRARVERTHIPIDLWIEQGWITATPGNVINYDAIELRMLGRLRKWKARPVELAFDPWQAQHFAQDMAEEGFHACESECERREGHLVEMPNTGRYMNLGVKTAEELVLSGRLEHGGNPVARWMFGNVEILRNSAGQRKIDKERSAEKVDGMSVLVMAAGRAAVHLEKAQEPSVYEKRGLLSV